jgi:CxxC-x17-CxxC domain-containing protein
MLIIGKHGFFQLSTQQLEVIVITQRTVFEVKCSDCGETTTVSFKPTPGRQVYCRTCYAKHTPNRATGFNQTRSTIGFNPKQAWARRRDIGTEKKASTGVFGWSLSTQINETT